VTVDRESCGLNKTIPIFCDLDLFNVAGPASSDLMAMAGFDVEYFVLERSAPRQDALRAAGDPWAPDWDPLYGEPFQVTVDDNVVKTWTFRESREVKLLINSIEDDVASSEKGQQTSYVIEGTISRFETDAQGFAPTEGDIIKIPKLGLSTFPTIYEVSHVDTANWVGNTGRHVSWDVKLIRLEKYAPERRLEG